MLKTVPIESLIARRRDRTVKIGRSVRRGRQMHDMIAGLYDMRKAAVDVSKTLDYGCLMLWELQKGKRPSLKHLAAKYLDMDSLFAYESRTDTEAPRSYWQTRADQYLAARDRNSRCDWREPESAEAWGIMYRNENMASGWRFVVSPANGHVLMTPDEWHMILDRKKQWCWDLAMADMAEINRASMRKIHEAEQEWLFGKTLLLYPRHEVIYHLGGETWIWNNDRSAWTVE